MKSVLIFVFALILIVSLLNTRAFAITTIAITGDVGCKTDGKNTISKMLASKANVTVFAGDLSYKKTGEKCFINLVKGANNVLLAIGNHDSPEEHCNECTGAIIKFMNLSKPYYSRNIGNETLILVMDTQSNWNKGSPQFKFINETLSKSNATQKFVVSHKIFKTSPSKHPVEKNMLTTYDPLFKKYNVTAVITAHNHNYQRFDDNYFVIGSGGRGHYPLNGTAPGVVKQQNTDFGYILITINGEEVSGKFISNNGNILDTFQIKS